MNHFDMELTQKQAGEYKRATKRQKGEILTQYCKLTGVSRNLGSKRFKKVIKDIHPRVLKEKWPTEKRGRKPIYTSIHKAIMKKAWKLSDNICGERLHPVIGSYITQLENNGKLKYYGNRYILESKKVSERTLKRVISGFPKSGKKRYKGNASIYKEIPINAHFGKNAYRPGYIEVDYVENNGGSSTGQFASTGTYVDVCLSWIGRSAALGKSLNSVSQIHDNIEKKIYHNIYEYHPDNAKPILKLLLERKLNPKKRHYAISRSRPYRKEDNGHVEQKNNDKVRKLVGYHRYDTKEQISLLNQLYNTEDLISNFFIPSVKLIEKIKDDKGRVVHRKYDKAKTAYQRLMESGKINKATKKQVSDIYQKLNLIELRAQSDKLREELFQTTVSRN